MANDKVELMNGEPEIAVRKLAMPIMLSMFLSASYHIIDGIWVSGLGEAAITGIAFVTPLTLLLNGLAAGIANGATSSISRAIGAKNREKASQSAIHSFLIFLLISIFLTLFLIIFQKPILEVFGASGQSFIEAYNYSTPIFLGIFSFIFAIGGCGVLRGEGDMKRSMYAITVTAILNIILDPIFIYVLGWGTAGAGFSTVISIFGSALVIFYWILIKKDTYVNVTYKGFEFDSQIVFDILKVGIPASFDRFIVPFAMGLYIMFISIVGGKYGVASFASGQRLYLLGIMPLTAVSSAVAVVSGNSFGAKNWDYLSRTHAFGTKFAMMFSVTIALLLVIFAPQFSLIFTYSPKTAHLIPGITDYLRIACFGLIFVGLGMPSTFFYQGIGRGTTSLVWVILRELIFNLGFIYLFGFIFDFGLTGIWAGFAIGSSIASILNFLYARYTIRKLKQSANDN